MARLCVYSYPHDLCDGPRQRNSEVDPGRDTGFIHQTQAERVFDEQGLFPMEAAHVPFRQSAWG